jgi:hypothetical protein
MKFKFLRQIFSMKSLGFGLAESMIALAISGGAALVIYKMIDESAKSQRLLENKDEVQFFAREIINKLGDRQACYHTLRDGFYAHKFPIMLENLRDRSNNISYKIPFAKSHLVQLKSISIEKIDVEKRVGYGTLKFSHKVQGKEFLVNKKFDLEFDFGETGEFTGCVSSSGTVNMDPKEACDMVLGFDPEGNSYFQNTQCQYARAACEHMGRNWIELEKKCSWSDKEKREIREELCLALDFQYNPSRNACEVSPELLQKFIMKNSPEIAP